MQRSAFALVSVLAWVLAAELALGTQDPPLFPAARFPAGVWPESLVVVDVNEDGWFDVVTANRGSNDVTVLLGGGAGRFRPSASFEAMNEPRHLAAGDFNEDGHVDLAVVGQTLALAGTVVLFGDGSGTFSAPIPLGVGGSHVHAVDLDADGHLDLVQIAPWGPGGIDVRLGDGRGGFAPAITSATPNSIQGLALGDLDGDGILDAVTARPFSGELHWLRGLPGGAFAAAVAVPVGLPVEFVTLGDLDGDGDLDLIATCFSPSVVLVLLGDGLGNFGVPTRFPANVYCEGATVADADLDGDLDVVAWLSGAAGVMLGDGTGALGPVDVHLLLSGPVWLDVIDVDSDRQPDLVFAAPDSNSMGTASGLGAGKFQVLQTILGASHPSGVAAMDFDSDGDQDLVLCNAGPFGLPHDEDVWLLAGDGAGRFEPLGHLTAGERPSAVLADDLSGDGRLDLAVANGDSNDFSVLLATPRAPFFGPPEHFETGASPRRLIAVDLDHDGHSEIVTLGIEGPWPFQGSLSVHRALGGGRFAEFETAAVGLFPGDLCAGDLDGDGHQELVVACAGEGTVPGQLWIFRGDGAGSLGTPVLVSAGTRPIDVEAVDLSGDGVLDLVVVNDQHTHWSVPDRVSVLLGDGRGGFDLVDSQPVGSPAYRLACADADGDGRTDVIVTGGSTSVLRGEGAGRLGGAELFAHGESSDACVRDLDGDLRVDVASTDFYMEGVVVAYGRLAPPPPCSIQTTWCSAKPNSQGCLPRICSKGAPSVGGPDDFAITAEHVLSHQVGIFVWSFGGATQPLAGGTLCLAPPVVRTALQVSGGVPGVHDCSGTYSFPFTQAYMASQGLGPGTHVFGQYWSRDPWLPPPATIGLTDSIRFVIAP